MKSNLPAPHQMVHTGRLYWYKKRRFGRNSWTECWMVMYADGTVVWYNDKHYRNLAVYSPINISNNPESLIMGSAERLHPPVVTEDTETELFRYFGIEYNKRIHWFYIKGQRDLVEWINALATSTGKSSQFDSILEKIQENNQYDTSLTTKDVNIYSPSLAGMSSKFIESHSLDSSDLWQQVIEAENSTLEHDRWSNDDDKESGFSSEQMSSSSRMTITVDVHAPNSIESNEISFPQDID